MAKFLQDLLGDMDAAVKLGQDFCVADQRKIAKRRGVADDGH